MGKRARRRPPRSERDSLGCMWSLIRIFDFRRSRKLLSDRRHGSSRHDVSRSKLNDVEEIRDRVDGTKKTEFGRGCSGKPSVKALIEEEMAGAQSLKKIPRDEIERILSDLGREIHLEKNEKQSRKKIRAISDLHVDELKDRGSLDSNVLKCIDEGSDFSFELAPNQVEIYKNHGDYQSVDFENNTEAYLALNSNVDRKHNDLMDSYRQKALDNLAEVVISHRIIDQKHLNGSKVDQSGEFLNTLEILSSNKELFLKLLQDPDLNIFERLKNLRSIQGGSIPLVEEIGGSEQSEEYSDDEAFNKQIGHNFFWTSDKLKARKSSEGGDNSQAFSRIVILKPNPSGNQDHLVTKNSTFSPQSNRRFQAADYNEKVVSNFSLREIKRRLRNSIGASKREQHLISMDGVVHKVSYGCKDSVNSGKRFPSESSIKSLTSKTSAGTENASRPSSVDKNIKQKNCRINNKSGIALSNDRSLFYEEAKKHLVEIIDDQNQCNCLPIGKVPKSLATLLYLAEYAILSPRCNTGEEEPHLSPKDTRLSTKQEDDVVMLDPSRQEVENVVCEIQIATDEQVIDTNSELAYKPSQEENYGEKEIKAQGGREIVDVEDINMCSHSDVSSESVVSECDISIESFSEGGSEQGQLEKPELVDPSVSIFPNSPVRIVEKPEISSSPTIPETFTSSEPIFPISFERNNDIPEEISEEKTTQTTQLTNSHIQQSEIQFKEYPISLVPLRNLEDKKSRFEYIATVIEASGLSTGESLERWYMDDQLLDPFLFNEVGASYNFNDDSLLLFDCIGEVLFEIREKFFQLTPSVSFVKQRNPTSRGVNIILEASKGVEWHFQNQIPITLDQMIRKDMEGKSWTDLRSKSESIINESQDAILDDLLEETVFDFWL